jgi:hypothetical protein
VFLLRTVLEEAASFDEALQKLSQSPIPCDCLLLLTGVAPGEAVVIERTPLRHAIRRAEGGRLSVTNGYRKLIVEQSAPQSQLLSSWCERFDRIESLVDHQSPQTAVDCFEYLSDPAVRMDMTVQQMVFRAATGEYWLR